MCTAHTEYGSRGAEGRDIAIKLIPWTQMGSLTMGLLTPSDQDPEILSGGLFYKESWTIFIESHPKKNSTFLVVKSSHLHS